MTIRVAAIEVSHWHALYDAAYLRHLTAMPDVELVAIQDSDGGVAAKRAGAVGDPPTFTDYRKMLTATRPDFVVALGRHRQMADYLLKEMVQRGAESWTSPDPTLRCAIAAVNVAPIQITEIENWMWKTKKIRIRGGAPSKIRLSTPYYLLRKDVDRFLAAYDECRREKKLA